MWAAFPAILVTSAYVLEVYRKENDAKNRPAETVIQETEIKTSGPIKATMSKPAMLPGAGTVATAFAPYQGSYHPLTDSDPSKREEEVKVLNVANRFLYG
jgi:hypothetical protein